MLNRFFLPGEFPLFPPPLRGALPVGPALRQAVVLHEKHRHLLFITFETRRITGTITTIYYVAVSIPTHRRERRPIAVSVVLL